MNFKTLSKLKEIETQYTSFIIDIWGVLWDGVKPYKNALNTLKYLKAKNKLIILLSNAPRRSSLVAERLASIGIGPENYNKIISSGEICRTKFLKNLDKFKMTGNTYYFIGQQADKDITELLPLTETKLMREANFLLVCGTRKFEDPLEEYINELNLALSLKLPFICANPDKVVIRQTGQVLLCAGMMAQYYIANGGIVYQYGKPFKDTYQQCLHYLQKKDNLINRDNILCIGDSLETDILGAYNYGIDSLLIANGIHSSSRI